jgi:hypothetical protein
MTLSDDDIAHEGPEHLGRHAHVALQQFAKLSERGDDVLFLDALHVRPPAGSLELVVALVLPCFAPPEILSESRNVEGGQVMETPDCPVPTLQRCSARSSPENTLGRPPTE